MNLLSGVPSFGLGANHRAKSRGDPGHMNPFEGDKPNPKPRPKMTEKDSIRSYNFISDLAKAGAIAFAKDTGITENTTRAQIRGNKAQEEALKLATEFAAYALGRGMATMDLAKYGDGSDPIGSYIKQGMNLTSSDESDSSTVRAPVGRAFIAVRNLAQYCAMAKEKMDQVLGYLNAPARLLIHATQETQLGVSAIAGSFISSVKTAMPIIKTSTRFLNAMNSARAAKSGFMKWVDGLGTKSPARVVAKPQLNIDNAPAVDIFSPFDTGLDLQYKLGVAEHKLRVESQIGNQSSYREALNNYMRLAAKAGVMVSQSQIPPPPSNITTGGYITSGGGNISNPIIPQTIQPQPFQPTQPPPVLNPTQFAGLGEAPEAETWLWIMAGAAALYLIMEPETRLSRK